MKLSPAPSMSETIIKDPTHGALVPPLYFSALYSKEENGEWGNYDYSRTGNPTRAAFEETIANLEGASGALAFSSGMAAIHCATMLLVHRRPRRLRCRCLWRDVSASSQNRKALGYRYYAWFPRGSGGDA